MGATDLTNTTYEPIHVTNRGVPMIAGATMKVMELVVAQFSCGWSPEELHSQYPHLALGQIYSALAFCWDHKDELNSDIAALLNFADEARRKQAPSHLLRSQMTLRSNRS